MCSGTSQLGLQGGCLHPVRAVQLHVPHDGEVPVYHSLTLRHAVSHTKLQDLLLEDRYYSTRVDLDFVLEY